MGILYNISILILSRGLVLIGFFLIPSVLTAEDFRSYAMYFAVWQLLSQIFTLQLGVTFFRCGINSKFNRVINELGSLFYYILIVITLFFVVFIFIGNIYLLSIVTASVVSIFIIVSELARARFNERIVFFLYTIPGVLYVSLFFLGKTIFEDFSVHFIVGCEFLLYLLMTLFLLEKTIGMNKFSYSRFISGLKRLLPFWRRFSLPLIPNNIIWYFYFNAPIVIGYKIIDDAEQYNSMALMFRFVVAISTVSSMLALVLQKDIVRRFESDSKSYYKIKEAFKKIFIPALFFLCLVLVYLKFLFDADLKMLFENYFYLMFLNGFAWFVCLFYLFIGTYLMSHYFVAEKDLSVISPSMGIGFFVYIVSVFIGVYARVEYATVAVVSLVLSLLITFLIRYFWLFRKELLND